VERRFTPKLGKNTDVTALLALAFALRWLQHFILLSIRIGISAGHQFSDGHERNDQLFSFFFIKKNRIIVLLG
jgi:hypothetical protein